MKTPTLITLGAALLIATITVTAQDAGKKPTDDQAAMMEAWQKLIAPGPQHKELRKLAGDYTVKQQVWMAPGTPPMDIDGTSKIRVAMGGRYLIENFNADMGPMGKFFGRGTYGYDKIRKEYVHSWIDNMNTGISITRGKETKPGVIELHGEEIDPMTNQKVKFRAVSSTNSEGKRVFQMYATKKGQEEYKMMEIVYTKTGEAPKKKKKGAADSKKKD